MQTCRPATLLKRVSNTGVFLSNLKIFKNTYFEEHMRTTVSECSNFFNEKNVFSSFSYLFFCCVTKYQISATEYCINQSEIVINDKKLPVEPYVNVSGDFPQTSSQSLIYLQFTSFVQGNGTFQKNCRIRFENLLSMMKNAFLFFIFKALLVLKIFKFLTPLFGHIGKTFWLGR